MSIFSLFKRKKVYEFQATSSLSGRAIDEFLSYKERLEKLHNGKVEFISVDIYGFVKYQVISAEPSQPK